MLRSLNYGKISLLLPILVVIVVVICESFKELIPLEIREKYAFWFYLVIYIPPILACLTSMVLAICGFFKKQSIGFGIIGILLDLPILAFFGWMTALLIILEMIHREPLVAPRLN